MVTSNRPLPWHDTPSCKQSTPVISKTTGQWEEETCGGPLVPVREMANGYDGERGARIACAACGHGIVGTAEEVARAERSSSAFRMLERGEIYADRGCAMCNGALPLDRFRLCASCMEKDNAARQGTLF